MISLLEKLQETLDYTVFDPLFESQSKKNQSFINNKIIKQFLNENPELKNQIGKKGGISNAFKNYLKKHKDIKTKFEEFKTNIKDNNEKDNKETSNNEEQSSESAKEIEKKLDDLTDELRDQGVSGSDITDNPKIKELNKKLQAAKEKEKNSKEEKPENTKTSIDNNEDEEDNKNNNDNKAEDSEKIKQELYDYIDELTAKGMSNDDIEKDPKFQELYKKCEPIIDKENEEEKKEFKQHVDKIKEKQPNKEEKPEETTQDQSKPEETTQDQSKPEETKEDVKVGRIIFNQIDGLVSDDIFPPTNNQQTSTPTNNQTPAATPQTNNQTPAATPASNNSENPTGSSNQTPAVNYSTSDGSNVTYSTNENFIGLNDYINEGKILDNIKGFLSSFKQTLKGDPNKIRDYAKLENELQNVSSMKPKDLSTILLRYGKLGQAFNKFINKNQSNQPQQNQQGEQNTQPQQNQANNPQEQTNQSHQPSKDNDWDNKYKDLIYKNLLQAVSKFFQDTKQEYNYDDNDLSLPKTNIPEKCKEVTDYLWKKSLGIRLENTDINNFYTFFIAPDKNTYFNKHINKECVKNTYFDKRLYDIISNWQFNIPNDIDNSNNEINPEVIKKWKINCNYQEVGRLEDGNDPTAPSKLGNNEQKKEEIENKIKNNPKVIKYIKNQPKLSQLLYDKNGELKEKEVEKLAKALQQVQQQKQKPKKKLGFFGRLKQYFKGIFHALNPKILFGLSDEINKAEVQERLDFANAMGYNMIVEAKQERLEYKRYLKRLYREYKEYCKYGEEIFD